MVYDEEKYPILGPISMTGLLNNTLKNFFHHSLESSSFCLHTAGSYPTHCL